LVVLRPTIPFAIPGAAVALNQRIGDDTAECCTTENAEPSRALEISRYATEISNSAGCATALFGFIPH
jgi:hypothetical protein